MTPEPHLSAHKVRRSFRIGSRRIEVLRGIDLEIARGETVFLCGASGAGKTTLLYSLAGLERPDGGEIIFEGKPLYRRGSSMDAKVRNEKMGFVFQSYFLLPELTALENVLLPSLIGNRQQVAEATSYLERVGLADRLHHLPNEMSGGEQQRVAIARALVNDPAMLFADEPTGNLDSGNGRLVMTLLLDLTRERQRTLVVVTHDQQLAARGDRQVFMQDGLLIQPNPEPLSHSTPLS